MSHYKTIPPITAFYQARAGDAIAWNLWGEAAFRKAQRANKPIFLHIGYASCYWCQRMASEAFRNPAIVTYLQRHFVPVVVDRDQRPDLAAAYQTPTVAMTGQTGWPLNLFLTPEGGPYHGGTYFPPTPELMGETTFPEVMAEALNAWKSQADRPKVEEIANEMLRQMGEGLLPLLDSPALPRVDDPREAALTDLREQFDARYGGFGQSAKFTQPLMLLWLLEQADQGQSEAREMALRTLVGMARGGIYDVLGGGFHLYTDDAAWRQPRFEKNLPNNALLARAYTAAYRLTGEAAFRSVAESTLDFILRDLALSEGLFAAAQSGDNLYDEGEGRYFTWTAEEVRAKLPPEEAELLIAAYDLAQEPRTLQRVLPPDALAERFDASPEAIYTRLAAAKAHLKAVRDQRFAPPVDETAIVAWNAYAVIALTEAGMVFGVPRYIEAAIRTLLAIRNSLRSNGGYHRGVYRGEPTGPGFLEDYAAVGLALLALHTAQAPAPDGVSWLYEATEALEAIEARFAADWGYYDTDPAIQDLPFSRPRELLDGNTPSGNALAATLLARLARATGENAFRTKAQTLLARMVPAIAKHPSAFPQWLLAWDALASA